jgi:hypothetical protein
MDRALSDLFISIFAVSIISGSSLFGLWLFLRAKRESRRERLVDSETWQAELDALRAELGQQVAELQERVDFAERLLAQGRPPQELERRPTTPV